MILHMFASVIVSLLHPGMGKIHARVPPPGGSPSCDHCNFWAFKVPTLDIIPLKFSNQCFYGCQLRKGDLTVVEKIGAMIIPNTLSAFIGFPKK